MGCSAWAFRCSLPKSPTRYRINLQHLVAVVVDYFDGDLACFGWVEGAAGRGIQSGPRGLINFGAQGAFQLDVGFLGAGEVSVANKEALSVIVGVDKPAGDIISRVAADFACGRVVDVQTLDLHHELSVLLLPHFNIRFAEIHEEIAGAGFLQQIVAHGEVVIHAGGHYHELSVTFGFFRYVRVKGEAANHQEVKTHALHGFLGGFFYLLRADRTVLGADGNGRAPRFSIFFHVLANGVNPDSGEGFQAVEFKAFILEGVLNAGLFEVFDDHRSEVPVRGLPVSVVFGCGPFLIAWEQAIRGEAFYGEGAGDPDAFGVFVRLVVEQLGFGVAGDGDINLLAGHAFFDVGIVGDALERYVRHALIYKSPLDVR